MHGFFGRSRRAFEAGEQRLCGSMRLTTSVASLVSDDRITFVTRFLRVTKAVCPRGKRLRSYRTRSQDVVAFAQTFAFVRPSHVPGSAFGCRRGSCELLGSDSTRVVYVLSRVGGRSRDFDS